MVLKDSPSLEELMVLDTTCSMINIGTSMRLEVRAAIVTDRRRGIGRAIFMALAREQI
jgi:hypothetical protein